jgi:hypothetical protein
MKTERGSGMRLPTLGRNPKSSRRLMPDRKEYPHTILGQREK